MSRDILLATLLLCLGTPIGVVASGNDARQDVPSTNAATVSTAVLTDEPLCRLPATDGSFYKVSDVDAVFRAQRTTTARISAFDTRPNSASVRQSGSSAVDALPTVHARDLMFVSDGQTRDVRTVHFDLNPADGPADAPAEVPGGLLAAPEPTEEIPTPDTSDSLSLTLPGDTPAGPAPTFLGPMPAPTLPDDLFRPMLQERTVLSTRLGYWAVTQKGSPIKVGEYQSTKDSMFANVDGLVTNGVRTYDFNLSQLDNDARHGNLNWYNPWLRSKINYDSFLRHLDRDPLSFYVDFNRQPPLPLPGPPQNYRDMKEDQSVGEDFAIRVQQLEASFKGNRTGNFNWRLNVWGMRKTGERQANAVAHCFQAQNAVDTNGNPALGPACHQLSQTQRIDWLTAEIEPAVQAKFGNFTAEYARTMRTLTTDDQVVTRPYDSFGFASDQPYAMVPENYTYIDRLKLGATFQNNRNFYGRLYSGSTENQFRDTNRRFSGVDLRLTDQSIAGLSVTGYGKQYNQSGSLPTTLLPFETVAALNAPLGYDRTTLGVTSTWTPFYGDLTPRGRLRLTGGYEYRQLDRSNAVFPEAALVAREDSTLTNQFHLRASTKLTSTWNSFTGYRFTFVDSPLYGVPIANTTTNTNLPTDIQRIEFGNTWTPTSTFMLHNLLSFHGDNHHSNVTRFDSDNSDIVLSYWYAPVTAWSFSGGVALYSNLIDQDITLGSKVSPLTVPWQYTGRSSVVNLGTTYAWSSATSLSGSVDWVRGHNAFDPIAGYSDLPYLSDVIVETTRFTTGVDHMIGPNSSLYVRYQLMDYDDKSDSLVGGTLKMVLLGMNARF